tara:strand:+ start:4914 stop:7304 length:2391 start_codon:yes stop_codon:yes gene_type:complete
MAKPSLDDLIGSIRDPKKQARKDALSKVPVSKTSPAAAAAKRADKFVDKAKTAMEKGQRADSLAAKQNRMQRAKALRKRAQQLTKQKTAGQERMDRVKAGLKQATSGPKVQSGSTFTGDAGGYGALASNLGNAASGLGKAAVAATGVDQKLKTKAKAIGQRMFSKSKNRGLKTGVSKPSAKPAKKVTDPWKSNKPQDPWKEEYLWEVDKKKETEGQKIIKPMSGKNTITVNPDIKEEAVSRKQQRFMGMVRAAQKGEGAASPEVAQVAASMKKKDVKDFASTKHKGLPEKKVSKESFEIDPQKHRQAQRAKKIRTLSQQGSTEGERRAAKSKTKGPALYGEGFSTVEDMHGNVMAHVVDFTAHEIIEDEAKKCPDGKYWCYTDKKCKTIPRGWHVGRGGYIEKDEDDDSKPKEGNGNGNGNGEGGNGNGGGSVSEGNKSGDNSLRDWFGKSRSSDGTPGWVQLGGKYSGKPCAKQPGQTTKPKCGSSKMKRNLSKDEEEAAFRRKNRKDPNPDRKGKAINVKTEETMKESHVPGKPAEKLGAVTSIPKNERDAARERLLAKAKAKRAMKEAAGEKDACYKKVKATAKVWPSAYASGRLVQCRKKGAANWGNKTKKEEFENYTFERLMEKCWKGYRAYGMKKKGNRMVPNCKPVREETVHEGRIVRAAIRAIDKTNPPLLNSKRRKIVDALRRKEISDTVKRNAKKSYSGKAAADVKEDWQKKSGKNPEGGLNEKGRKSYERENPGSDLKRPSKKVGNPRRKSFCARMSGMKKKLTSKKTANDPDSRINKSLRAWNC